MIKKLFNLLFSNREVIPEKDMFNPDGTFKSIVQLEKEGWYD